MAVFRVEKTRDYTVMSNHHLKNKNLSLKAKGLLSQMLSLSDEMRKDEKRESRHNNYDYWKSQIQTNVDYESLRTAHPYDLRLIDEIIENMVETVMSNGDTIQIASNNYPHSIMKERFLNVDYEHIQYIIDCFKENAKMKEIKNIKQYLKAAIFNAPAAIDSYFTAMVQRDMYGY